MQDEILNKGIKTLHGWVRPVKVGVRITTQVSTIEQYGPRAIHKNWVDVVGKGKVKQKGWKRGAIREGEALLVYDISYLGRSFRRTLDMWDDILKIGAIILLVAPKVDQLGDWDEQKRLVKLLKRNAGRYGEDKAFEMIEKNKNRKYKKKMEPGKYLQALDSYLNREGTVQAVCDAIRHNGKKGITMATLYQWLDKVTCAIQNGDLNKYHGVSEKAWKEHLELRDIEPDKNGVWRKVKRK